MNGTLWYAASSFGWQPRWQTGRVPRKLKKRVRKYVDLGYWKSTSPFYDPSGFPARRRQQVVVEQVRAALEIEMGWAVELFGGVTFHYE